MYAGMMYAPCPFPLAPKGCCAISRCELTHLAREPIDYARAVAQHDAYVEALVAFERGSPEGLAQWLTFHAASVQRGAAFARTLCR